MIITRFAPSPTGNLHIGGARTALFNYLYAKHCNGKFLLRFEDTDKQRSKEEHAEQIRESLHWLGIKWDNEDVPYQSQRIHIYESYRDHLLEKELAYHKDGAIYLKGKNDIEDFVIWKSDGMPVFHFAVVIDDHEMGVNCIIRGVDHLTNTDKHKLIYEYLGFPLPEWHHMPLIVDDNDKPLSKRRDDASVTYYQEKGYIPEAVMNYLSRLGWGHGNQEIFTEQELIDFFDVAKVSKNPAKIDLKKMNWLNSQYVSNADHDLLKRYTQYKNIAKAIDHANRSNNCDDCLKKIQAKAFTLAELDLLIAPFVNDFMADKELLEENKAFVTSVLPLLKVMLENVPQEHWTEAELETKINEFIESNSLSMKEVAMPLQQIITGQKKSLDTTDILVYVGRKTVLNRLHVL